MKPILKCVPVALALLLSAGAGFSQTAPAAPKASAPVKDDPLPTVDQIVEKCAQANGGKAVWGKLSTLVMTGTIDLPTFNMSGKVEVYAKAPNKILRVVNIGEGQFVQIQGFDGKTGWKSDPQSGLKQLADAELEEAKVDAVFDTEVRLKEIYPDMKVTGRTKVGDHDAYAVQTHEGRKALTFYFDTQTGLRIGMDSEGPDDTGTVQKISMTFDEYSKVGDVQVAHHVRGVSPVVTFDMRFQDPQFNVPVDDAKFAMPAAAGAAAPK